jgi:hypothetical protein
VIDPTTRVHEARRIGALWTGLLLAPTAFLANLEVGYLFVYPSCAAGSVLTIHVVHGVCLVLALAGGLIAWRSWQAEGLEWPGEAGGPGGRSRFMAGLGVTLSGLFVLTILAQWLPTFTLHPCQ